MKAADLADLNNDHTQVKYPVILTPKYDGYRALAVNGVAMSNNMTPHFNKFIQSWFKRLHGLDGELIVDAPTGGNVLGRTSSGVKTVEGEPNFTFYAFDMFTDKGASYTKRLQMTERYVRDSKLSRLVYVPHYLAKTPEDLLAFEEKCLADGYEGVMGRHPDGPYKFGRSTLREGFMWKLKRFSDSEGVVLRLEEAEFNGNVATVDALGRTKRSHAQAGKSGKGMVGTIVILDKKWGELRVAPGKMSHANRIRYWNEPELLIGKIIHHRSFGYGLKDKPRYARFYDLR